MNGISGEPEWVCSFMTRMVPAIQCISSWP